jgi:putative chitinase
VTAAPLLTLPQLKQAMPYAGPRAQLYLSPLVETLAEFHIDTPRRVAHFLAQIAHESGSLRYTREIASGAAYEGRGDLGNTQPGDGMRFKGRGLIQITGRANYAACSKALFGDARLINHPELLEDILPACRSAGWFWARANLNVLADASAIRRITRAINGGYNGYADRLTCYGTACKALGIAPSLED